MHKFNSLFLFTVSVFCMQGDPLMATEHAARLPAGIRDAQGEHTGNRLEASHVFTIGAPVDAVFGLLDAVSECDWVDDWDPTPIYPAELSRDEGTVFTLTRDGRTSVWTVLRYSPTRHLAEYLIAEPAYQHRWIYIHCGALGDHSTQVSVSYVTTALSQAGQADLHRYGKTFIEDWKAPMEAALKKMNKLKE
jgi:hypothetical protein